MDTDARLHGLVFAALQADAALLALIGDRIYKVWAEKDATAPYLVQRWRQNVGPDRAIRPATLDLEIFDFHDTTARATTIRQRVIKVLEQNILDSPETPRVRFWLASEAWVPEDHPKWWHLSMRFDVRYGRKGETQTILGG